MGVLCEQCHAVPCVRQQHPEADIVKALEEKVAAEEGEASASWACSFTVDICDASTASGFSCHAPMIFC